VELREVRAFACAALQALCAPRATHGVRRPALAGAGLIHSAGDAGAAPGGREAYALAVVIAEGRLRAQVVSSLLAGAAVGSLGGSGLADSFGRRTTLLLDAVPMAVGALLSATATGLQVGAGPEAGRSREGTA